MSLTPMVHKLLESSTDWPRPKHTIIVSKRFDNIEGTQLEKIYKYIDQARPQATVGSFHEWFNTTSMVNTAPNAQVVIRDMVRKELLTIGRPLR